MYDTIPNRYPVGRPRMKLYFKGKNLATAMAVAIWIKTYLGIAMLQIKPTEYFSPEEFFERYGSSGGFINQRLVEVLKDALAIIPLIRSRYPGAQSDIAVRVSNSEDLVAESNPYSIVISIGMIKHCIAAPCMPIDEICPAMSSTNFNYGGLAAIALAWVVAHEYFHIVRRHNEVATAAIGLPGRPYANSISNALEHDADLLAVAAVYRLMQKQFGGVIHDLDVRRITVYSIFFSLRTFNQGSSDGVHSAMPERLFHLLQKLVQVTKGPEEKVSVAGLTDYSRERLEPLLQSFAQCEQYFHLMGDGDGSNLLWLFREFANNKRIFEISESWEWISPTVEKITGGRANNKNYKGPDLNRICVFCGAKNPISIPVFAPWIVSKLNMGCRMQALTDMALGVSLKDGSTHIHPSQPYMRQSTFGSEQIDRICESCKNDWLDPLDVAVRPLIEPLIDGELLSIGEEEAKIISVYMCAIAVLNEYTDPNPDNRLILPAYKNKLPLYFDRLNFIVAHPYRGQSDFGQIQPLAITDLNEAFDSLHLLLAKWGAGKIYQVHGNK